MRSLYHLVLFLLTGTLLTAEPVITDFGYTPGGKVSFTVKSNADSYHVLRRSPDLLSVGTGRAVAVVPGAEDTVSITDSGRPFSQGFYQVETYSNSAPADTDGHG